MTDKQASKGLAILILSSLLLLWELLYRLGLTDRTLFSHPIGTLKVLVDLGFLTKFTFVLIVVAFTSLLGGAIAVFLGFLIMRSVWVTQATLPSLRTGRWVPFLVYWALPIWPPQEGYHYDPIFWAWIATLAPIVLATCYSYLSARSIIGLGWRETRALVVRESFIQTLLISLVSQGLVSPYGWHQFFLPEGGELTVGYTALFLLVAFLFLLNLASRSSFNNTAATRATVLLNEVASRSRRSLWGGVLLGVICLIIWHLLSLFGFYPLISSPLDSLKAAYRLLAIGTGIPKADKTIWGDIGISLLEVTGGLILAGAAALLVCKRISTNSTFRSLVILLLPLTYVVPIVLPLFLFYWLLAIPSLPRVLGTASFPLQTTAGVAFLAFFPFVQALWGLRTLPLFCRILMAVDEALPFAVVAMFFGEVMHAVAGLGFFTLVARHLTHRVTEGIATSLISVALLVILSSTIRWIVKRHYFPTQS